MISKLILKYRFVLVIRTGVDVNETKRLQKRRY